MPRIFDNIEQSLLPALQDTIRVSQRGDFCVGYFNLRGWKQIDSYIDQWAGGEENCCRLLVGMPVHGEDEELRDALRLAKKSGDMDMQSAVRFRRKLAEVFRTQLMRGAPNNEDETGLRKLAEQLRSKKLVVKLFLAHSLHAKLYLLFGQDPVNPITAFLGSSNLTFAGLAYQGELNVDIQDHDATEKLADWFNDRWDNRWCFDISEDVLKVIEESWAREELIPPYQIYVKMAYHLSQEARTGLAEYNIPKEFGDTLFPFQTAAVKIAVHHINKRGGVIIGDVVGLGKTLMATALAKIFENDFDLETLIIAPPNLTKMWEDHRERYRLLGKVISMSQVNKILPDLRPYRVVLIDESHNLRNREGKRYKVIKDYIERSSSKVALLSATPYNKSYIDLSNQLRLFVPEDLDIGVAPEKLIREMGETEFIRKHQCSPRSIAAFEKSTHSDDWRELMRLYLIRRTRSFIQDNYAEPDSETGRKYLTFADGTRSYFPTRRPKSVRFGLKDENPNDQYARLYSDAVVDAINHLTLPRYGLGNKRYLAPKPVTAPSAAEQQILDDLSRAGKRLMGFCRTNLFKRLESSGAVFLLSLERHILRNVLFLYAIENNLLLPIGTQDASLLDSRITDEDADDPEIFEGAEDGGEEEQHTSYRYGRLRTEEDFKKRAKEVYDVYQTQYASRFKWISPSFFSKLLFSDLDKDVVVLRGILSENGDWNPAHDEKLDALHNLLTKKHSSEKVLVFSQFADTIRYLETQLAIRDLKSFACVTGESDDPTEMAWRFSPVSNDKRSRISPQQELRVLLATDVLSEGQNLQDACVVVNYDLPWAIIRLIQRAGRVDRIGQKAENILCYSFLPADGVERIIRLRARVRQRLAENAEVVGTDEAFFEDDDNDQAVRDLFTEKAGILDGEADSEIDLSSYAYEIWKNATKNNPELEKTISEMPSVVYATRKYEERPEQPAGAVVYVKTAQDNDALAWLDRSGKVITQSQFAILKAVECKPNEPALPRQEEHHELVRKGVDAIALDEKNSGGQLGRPSGARFRTYERLRRYADSLRGTLFQSNLEELEKAINDVYRYPLQQSAKDGLNRQLRSGVSNDALAERVIALRNDDRLSIIHETDGEREPQIICSMGLKN